ncbi:MAG: matrixin family metalloprotease [Candidatus Kaiserbacteria bacterium]|nr:matrixin family metalloprotease [Candidatus Kaiserbacteria bacterium]
MKWVLRAAFLLCIAAAAYVYRAPLRVFAYQTYAQVRPCSVPIAYGINSIDPRFGISTSTVLTSITTATGIWSDAAHRSLFVYDPAHAVLEVNFVYDTRQETTAKLKSLGLTVNDDLASYNAMKAKYNTLTADYKTTKAAFDTAYATYQQQSTLYQQQVNIWNAKGGAPADVYKQLNAQKAALDSQRAHIQTLQSRLNSDADSINAMVSVLNHMVSVLNLDASKYNSVGAGTGQEFEEAVFQSAPGKQSITVYEYDSSQRLTRVLSHEFGHALGLDHVADENAIMYRLNQSSRSSASSADIAELDRVCRI